MTTLQRRMRGTAEMFLILLVLALVPAVLPADTGPYAIVVDVGPPPEQETAVGAWAFDVIAADGRRQSRGNQ